MGIADSHVANLLSSKSMRRKESARTEVMTSESDFCHDDAGTLPIQKFSHSGL
jgi:hypothetical protein